MREPLTKEQVKAAIERKGDGSVPIMRAKWWGPDFDALHGANITNLAAQYPDDIVELWYVDPGYDVSPLANPEYRLGYKASYADAERHSIGSAAVLMPDWDDLDTFLEHYPDPNEPGNFDGVYHIVNSLPAGDNRYKVGCWWRLFHERFWGIRGMENLMMDYYDEMDGLKAIGKKVIEFYKVIIRRFKEVGCDGIFTSDDLGHQTGPMMSPAIFKELYLPLYKEIIDYTHSLGMHFFLHSCGDNSLLMDMLIEAGLDVFHPVQKGCMDFAETAKRYGDRISFLAGVDVQHLMPEATPEEIQAEINQMVEIMQQPGGGLLLAMGNGITTDTSLENIKAAYDAMYNR